MPYAVTCKSCGARFSVADDLFRKKLQGKQVTLRCRQCGSAIRINASKMPTVPSPPLPTGTGVTPASAEVAFLTDELGDEASFVALSPGLLSSAPPIADAPEGAQAPPIASSASSVAAPEPMPPPPSVPRVVSEPPVSSSDAPKLADLVERQEPGRARTSDDVDFLLGLSGSRGIDSASNVAAPALLTSPAAASPPKAEGPTPVRPENAPSAKPFSPGQVATSGTSVAARNEPGFLKYLLVAAALMFAGYVLFARRAHQEPPTPPPQLAVSAEANEDPYPPIGETETNGTDRAEDSNLADSSPDTARTSATPLTADSGLSPTEKAAAASALASAEAVERGQARAGAAGVRPSPRKPDGAPGGPFDKEAAAAALTTAASEAASCRKPGEPSGMASVVVTFAPSGRVTSATLNGPPFAGTATGGCIAATLRRARVPAFQGDKVTVAKTVVIQ